MQALAFSSALAPTAVAQRRANVRRAPRAMVVKAQAATAHAAAPPAQGELVGGSKEDLLAINSIRFLA